MFRLPQTGKGSGYIKEIGIQEVRLESSIPGVYMLSQGDDFPASMTAVSMKALSPQSTEVLSLEESEIGREWVDKNMGAPSVLKSKPMSLLRAMRSDAISLSKCLLYLVRELQKN